MPGITQICNREVVRDSHAESAWALIVAELRDIIGLGETAYYGGSPDFVPSSRTGGRDMVFEVRLNDTRLRTERDRPDINANELAKRVAEGLDRIHGNPIGHRKWSIGVLLLHGKAGWGESLRRC